MSTPLKQQSIGGVLVLAAVATALVWSGGVADERGQPAGGSSLEQRVAALERIVGPARPGGSGGPLLDRVDRIEKGLADINRALGSPSWSSVENNLRELEKALRESGRERRETARQLRELDQLRGTIARLADENARLQRSLGELERRVKQLESRR